MCLGSLKFWHKHKKRDDSSLPLTVTTGTGQPPLTTSIAHRPATSQPSKVLDDANVHSEANFTPDVQGNSATQTSISLAESPESPPATGSLVDPQPSPSLSKSPKSQKGTLQELLWNQAYDNLKSDEPKVVKEYETLLLQKLRDVEPSPASSPDDQITASALGKPEYMKMLVEAGLKRSEEIAEFKANLEEFRQVAGPVKTVMQIVVQAAPQAAIAWSCISFALEVGKCDGPMYLYLANCSKTLANPLTESSINRQGITYVLGMMKWYLELVDLLLDENSPSKSLRDQVEAQIIQLYRNVLLYQMKSVCVYYRKQIYVLCGDMIKRNDWAGALKVVKDAEDDMRKMLSGYTNASIYFRLESIDSTLKHGLGDIFSLIETQQKMDEDSENNRWLATLHQTDPVHDKTRIQGIKGELLRDSYHWVLAHDSYTQWEEDPHRHLLWIHGDPGKGKTMLLCGIIDELEKEPSNTLSYFFCQATQAKLSNATSVLRGLLYSLVHKYPQLIPYIRREYAAIRREQFEDHNAWEVLSKMFEYTLCHSYLHGVVLIVDALDECVDTEDRHKLLEFIRRMSSTYDVKCIISSRGCADIRTSMEDRIVGTFILSLEENGHFVSTAVAAYIKREVQNLAKINPYKRDSMVLAQVKDHLLKNAENTFLWVALVCKALGHPNIQESENVLRVLEGCPPGLDGLYRRMFDELSLSPSSELFQKILAVASVVKRPITLEELHFILHALPPIDVALEKLRRAVQSCGSMLNLQDNTVFFVHQSAVDFLRNNDLEGLEGVADRHRLVFCQSLEALRTSELVKRDIYGLKIPDIHIDDINQLEPDSLASLSYCCIYWIDHLDESKATSYIKDHGVVHNFLQAKLLYWIEALVLLRHLPQAIQGMQKLETLASRKSNAVKHELADLVRDANRFLLFHREMMENFPMQIYVSALLFSPKKSVVRELFFEEHAPEWVTATPGVDTWDARLHSLSGHDSTIKTVAYSMDGQWLLSGCAFGDVKVWQADNGTCKYTLEGCSDSSAFSGDSESFVSGSLDGKIMVYSMRTNHVLELKGHDAEEEASSMSISKDGGIIAYSLRNGMIRIWSVKKEACLCIIEAFEQARGGATIPLIALNANGRLLASVRSLSGIRIWDTSTGECKQVMEDRPMHRGWDGNEAIALSDDGTLVASGYKHISIWETKTGRLIQTLRHNIGFRIRLSSMTFSVDGQLLAASFDEHIYVWHTTTGELILKHEWCGHLVRSLSFSPDAQRLLLGCADNTIEVWDLSNRQANTSTKDRVVNLYQFDEDHFASYHPKVKELRIWGKPTEIDAATRCHLDDVGLRSIALSEDRRKFATASKKGKITIWDAKTGEEIRTFGHKCHPRRVTRLAPVLAFRNNLQLAVAAFEEINIWNTSDGSCVETHEEMCKSISQMTFSVNGRWLAYVIGDEEGISEFDKLRKPYFEYGVKLLDTKTRQLFVIWSMKSRFERGIDSISFSADNRFLAWSSRDTIYLRNLTTESSAREVAEYNVWGITLSFDKNVHGRLHTQYGFLDLSDTEPHLSSSRPPEENYPDPESLGQSLGNTSGIVSSREDISFRGYGLSPDLKWLMLDGHRLLHIPPDYTPLDTDGATTPVINESTLTWISRTGRVVRFCILARHEAV